MSDLTVTEFIEARITEDDKAAREDNDHSAMMTGFDVYVERVRIDLRALRAIVADHEPTGPMPSCSQCTDSMQHWRITEARAGAPRVTAPCDTVRHIAAIWADHPDYRKEWE